MRPRPILRFADQPELLVSGLLDGGQDIAGRTTLVDAPIGKGHVVVFSFNPIWRGAENAETAQDKEAATEARTALEGISA